MKYKLGLTLAMASLAGFAFVGPGQAGDEFKNKYQSGDNRHDCGEGDFLNFNGPLMMWPPNHKMQPMSITATDGDDGDPTTNPTDDLSNSTTLTVTPNLLDAVGGDGGPNGLDWNFPKMFTAQGDPSATVPFELRSERSGKGEGRTYTLKADAWFDGKPGAGTPDCTHTFEVLVPHDMSGGVHWKNEEADE